MSNYIDIQNNVWGAITEPVGGSIESEIGHGLKTIEDAEALGRAWISEMDSVGIATSIVFDWEANDIVLDLVEKFAPRFLGMVVVDPREPDAIATVEKYFDAGNFVGVKLNSPGCWSVDGGGYYYSDRDIFPFYEFCESRQITINFHTGTIYRSDTAPTNAFTGFCRPLDLDVVARTFRDLRMILGHTGRPLWEEALALANLPNVWADVTWSQLPLALYPRSIETALSGYGADRVMWGSDSHLRQPAKSRPLMAEAARIIRDLGYGEETVEKVLGGTAREFFSLGASAK